MPPGTGRIVTFSANGVMHSNAINSIGPDGNGSPFGVFVNSVGGISGIRSEEARRAAEICGAEATTLGQSDGDVNAADPKQRRLMIDLVRETRPDLIVTHHPGDYMGDHNETSKLVFDCSFHATLPLLETTKPNYRSVTPIYYMDTLMGLGFQPTEYVDVSAVIEAKTAMLEAHQSQLTWLRDHDGVDVVEQMRTVSRFRGLQCGVEYAEGFVPCLTWLRPTTRRLLP